MNRRNFTQSAFLAGLGLSAAPSLYAQSGVVAPHKYNLNYAPHLGMFRHSAGDDPIDQLNFMADQGFAAFEDNNMNTRPIALQEKMAATMRKRNLTMGVFVAYKDFKKPTLTSGKADDRTAFLEEIKASIPVAKRVNAKWMTVVPGTVDLKLVEDYQTANVVESLKQAAALLEPHDIVMVLEPLNWYRNHAGLFLKESPQAFQICKAVNSPSCKILFDIYHQQIQEGNLIPNIEKCWDEIAYFQIGDNPGRKEPTTGEINYKNIFKYIHSRGFKGVLGMEHGNSRPDEAGEMAVIDAYKQVDNFLSE
ncbi:MAG: TIM barrel protein [Flavobacteriaceae bacterium]|jgi:hydroxypyruvate isomerase|nr:TIM barrel protein [Flavobacteriaceae bacterium]MDG1966195.1 TIM barrel protein [Flavobacteriaceae bacterium]